MLRTFIPTLVCSTPATFMLLTANIVVNIVIGMIIIISETCFCLVYICMCRLVGVYVRGPFLLRKKIIVKYYFNPGQNVTLVVVFVIQQDEGVPCTKNSPVLLLLLPYPWLLSLNINVQEPSETANFQHNTNSNNNCEMQQKLHCYLTFSSLL